MSKIGVRKLAASVKFVLIGRMTVSASSGSTEDTVPIQGWVQCAKKLVVDAKVFLLTADIRSGVPGLPVAGHAQEELSNALVHVPLPDPKTEAEIAVDWDELKKQGHVTLKDVQLALICRLTVCASSGTSMDTVPAQEWVNCAKRHAARA